MMPSPEFLLQVIKELNSVVFTKPITLEFYIHETT
ncbi:hypothetical protein NIES4103_62270 [Nostoc sp. NIES-4103]|nr:hypothetical protein NIES4103_62270 [Nostoc sp. NIES-4103]